MTPDAKPVPMEIEVTASAATLETVAAVTAACVDGAEEAYFPATDASLSVQEEYHMKPDTAGTTAIAPSIDSAPAAAPPPTTSVPPLLLMPVAATGASDSAEALSDLLYRLGIGGSGLGRGMSPLSLQAATDLAG